jgi:hypothetical protein
MKTPDDEKTSLPELYALVFEEDHQTLRASLAEIEAGAPGCSLAELDASRKAAIAKGSIRLQ